MRSARSGQSVAVAVAVAVAVERTRDALPPSAPPASHRPEAAVQRPADRSGPRPRGRVRRKGGCAAIHHQLQRASLRVEEKRRQYGHRRALQKRTRQKPAGTARSCGSGSGGAEPDLGSSGSDGVSMADAIARSQPGGRRAASADDVATGSFAGESVYSLAARRQTAHRGLPLSTWGRRHAHDPDTAHDSADEIIRRRDFALSRMATLRETLSTLPEVRDIPDLCIYVTGSYGRGDATAASDVDIFPATGSKQRAAVITRRQDAGRCRDHRRLPPPGLSRVHAGRHLPDIHYVGDIQRTLGSREDDYRNHFTARMLLLLESICVYNPPIYEAVIGEILALIFATLPITQRRFGRCFCSMISCATGRPCASTTRRAAPARPRPATRSMSW